MMAERVNRDPIDTIIPNYRCKCDLSIRLRCKIFPIPRAFDIPLPFFDISVPKSIDFNNQTMRLSRPDRKQGTIKVWSLHARVYYMYIYMCVYIYNEIHTVKSRTIWLGRQMEINQCPIPSRCPHKYWFPIGRERNLCRGVCHGAVHERANRRKFVRDYRGKGGGEAPPHSFPNLSTTFFRAISRHLISVSMFISMFIPFRRL